MVDRRPTLPRQREGHRPGREPLQGDVSRADGEVDGRGGIPRQAKTGISREQGGYDSPDAEAIRNFCRSIYDGDVDAAKRLYLRLLTYGYTAQRFEAGIKASEPLAGLSTKDGSRKAFVDGLSPYDRKMLDKAQAYELRMSSMKLDARRIFPMEIKGYPAATRSLIESFQDKPREDLLERNDSRK